ncbi:hypothetical protein JKP88DRAFT_255727 [Tribonema minus]|uniref:Uncharacterized protein n=1 Tax=Tribonema minus TaxID=303371 RepID=A0A836CEM4_9STRA|nr:hypothetical protein JKP88DRAFT_255727 [Tribonema minus]
MAATNMASTACSNCKHCHVATRVLAQLKDELVDSAMGTFRRTAERSRWLGSFCMVHSSSRDTISGLGCALLQALQDEYPKPFIISVCVAGFASDTPLRRDTPLRHYNAASRCRLQSSLPSIGRKLLMQYSEGERRYASGAMSSRSTTTVCSSMSID